MSCQNRGYTLVEMLVAMAVTSIVLAGTYAAYGFFAKQQKLLLSQTELTRNAMRAIDLIETDIRMAGFTDHCCTNGQQNTKQPITMTSVSSGKELSIVFDNQTPNGYAYREFVHYYLNPTNNRLYRERRFCNDLNDLCDRNSSTAFSEILKCEDPNDPPQRDVYCTKFNFPKVVYTPHIGDPNDDDRYEGDPLLGSVEKFEITGMNPKSSGTFTNQYHTLKIQLELKSTAMLEGSMKDINKIFTFVARAKNVSLVP